ncbi:MAG: M23 family metallopeptidase [Candidatus Kerfeldbacteria bacterium]|nr:M23 family metallopeptidase [Candidatus Kerfeldbacteria bacterium]
MNKIVAVFFIPILLINLGCSLKPIVEPRASPLPVTPALNNKTSHLLVMPLVQAPERITKKPFGVKISPDNSPVSPERFAGYHTGVDFETIASEQNEEVKIWAVCAGTLILKKYASGYGGVAVQSCRLNGQAVTLVYGHLKLSSIIAEVKSELKAGEQIGVLGNGYSTETDNERKHLHLGIHKGPAVSLLGYVKTKAELDDWLDVAEYLK